MSFQEKDTYFVAVKLFLEKDGKLFIFKDKWGDWDLPGGRIKKDEFSVPLDQVIKRKMKEEIGEDTKYTIGKPVVFMRHERKEGDTDAGGKIVRIFAIGYKATFDGGEIKISDHHVESKWVDLKNFKPEEYFTGGWLQGVKEYLELRESTN